MAKLVAVSQGNSYLERNGASTAIWNVASGQQVARLEGHDAFHTAVDFSTDGNALVTGSELGEITVWDLNTHEERMTITSDAGHLQVLKFTPNGQTLISGDVRGRVQIWKGAESHVVEKYEQLG